MGTKCGISRYLSSGAHADFPVKHSQNQTVAETGGHVITGLRRFMQTCSNLLGVAEMLSPLCQMTWSQDDDHSMARIQTPTASRYSGAEQRHITLDFRFLDIPSINRRIIHNEGKFIHKF